MPGRVECPAMRKRLDDVRISLAAKCQILFGAAVILIIAACALYVPWKRMEQIIQDVNLQTAKGVADQRSWSTPLGRSTPIGGGGWRGRPSAGFAWPRLLSINPPKGTQLDRFERQSLRDICR